MKHFSKHKNTFFVKIIIGKYHIKNLWIRIPKKTNRLGIAYLIFFVFYFGIIRQFFPP